MTDQPAKERMFDKVLESARYTNIELKRTISRVLDGDTEELVRAVVEHVTEAMQTEICNGNQGDLIERVIFAKFKAFKEITGREFDTINNRKSELRAAIRRAQQAKVVEGSD